jgi:hypothetical protein
MINGCTINFCGGFPGLFGGLNSRDILISVSSDVGVKIQIPLLLP